MSTSQYFEGSPTVGSDRRSVRVELPDVGFDLTTDRGVFSHGALDRGTRLLLLEGPPVIEHGDLLDLGCGAGAIAVALALRAPAATVWAVDVNERARSLCAENAAAAGARNVTVAAPDEIPAAVRFRQIWSNPPIRIGKNALHALLDQWLDRLDEGGTAHLVVQKHLGSDSLAAWLAGEGWTVARRTSRAGFRILDVGVDRVTPRAAHSDPRGVDLDPHAGTGGSPDP
jgi:16S rRNA (guanine1207-N2)-methyltransferase